MCDKVHRAGIAASAKTQLDWNCACKAKAGILQKGTVWSNTVSMLFEAWYEMYKKPYFQELANVGVRVLYQVISASKCEQNWSAHLHNHLKIRNRLELATTERSVDVYSNSKIVAATRDADEPKMLAWEDEYAQLLCGRK